MNTTMKTFYLLLIFNLSVYPLEKEARNEVCKIIMQVQEYATAMEVAKDYIKRFPKEINGYICQDAACNSSGECKNSAENRALVLEIWHKYHKPKLIEKGAPLGVMHWPRKVLETKNWYIVAAEYYERDQFPGDSTTTSFPYRYVARSKGKRPKERTFELEHMKGQFESYTLVEAAKKTYIPIKDYETRQPDIFEVQNDLAKFLEGN